jgi:hypothetical protein
MSLSYNQVKRSKLTDIKSTILRHKGFSAVSKAKFTENPDGFFLLYDEFGSIAAPKLVHNSKFYQKVANDGSYVEVRFSVWNWKDSNVITQLIDFYRHTWFLVDDYELKLQHYSKIALDTPDTGKLMGHVNDRNPMLLVKIHENSIEESIVRIVSLNSTTYRFSEVDKDLHTIILEDCNAPGINFYASVSKYGETWLLVE